MKTTELMHRWSMDHPLPVHITTGELTAFMLDSPSKPPYVKQSKAVSVSIQLHGAEWRLKFRLNDPRYRTMFEAFYEDVYESTLNVKVEDAANAFIEIYKKWMRAFSGEAPLLTKEEIQGLIGEMCMINEVLLKNYPPKTVLDAWMITDKGKQDFIFADTWYEVKSTHVGSNKVIISSAEQLDCSTKGYLSIVKLKTTSVSDEGKVNLSILIDSLLKKFDEGNCGEEFLMKLAELGLPDEKYDCNVYEIVGFEHYAVSDEFPCLKRSNLPSAVGLVKYELYLDQITMFKV